MPDRLQLVRNRSRLSGLEVRDEEFVGLDLRGAVAQSSRWTGCHFERVRLSAAHLGDATFEGCEFVKCRFDRATLVSRIYRSRFEACDFDETNFRGADILGSEFLRGRAHYSEWANSTLRDCRVDLDLRNANLSFSTTHNVDFSGSSLWSAATPWNCAFFVGNTFDARQVGMALALLTHATLPQDLHDQIAAIVPARHRELTRRLVVAQR